MSDRHTPDVGDRQNDEAQFDEARFDDLLSRLVDDRLDAPDERELAALLRTSAAAREAYVRYVSLHAWLSWDAPTDDTPPQGANRHLGPLPIEPPADAASGLWPGVSDFVSRAMAFFAKPTPLSVSVATCVVAVVIAALAFVPLSALLAPRDRSPQVSETPPQDGVMPESELPVVAHVGQTLAPRWMGDARPFHGGDELRQGDSLHLADGTVEVLFADGARVKLRGPAEFVVLSPTRGRLYSGRLAARVPAPNGGFVVDTQAVVVKDLGTEFGIDVDHALTSAVRVYEGAVEATSHRTDDATPATPLRLVAGEAMRFHIDGPPTPMPHESQDETESLRRPITYRDVVVADRPLLYWSFDEKTGPVEEQAHGLARYRLQPLGDAKRAAHADLGTGLALGRAADLRDGGVFEGRIQHAGPPSAWALEMWLARDGAADGYSSQYLLHTNPGARAGGFVSNNPSVIFDYQGSADNELALHSSARVGPGKAMSRTTGGPILADRRWHHLFFVFYGDGVRGVDDRVAMYWDGQPVDTIRRQRFSASFRVDTLLVGATRTEGDYQFHGLVDEIALYDFGGLSSQAIERRAAEMVHRHRHAATPR